MVVHKEYTRDGLTDEEFKKLWNDNLDEMRID